MQARLARHSSGFTLVELVLVLVVAGVLAGVAVPRLMSQDAWRTRGAAIEVRAALRHAQQLAVSKNREVCVSLSATQVQLTLNPLANPGGVCSVDIQRPGSSDAYRVVLPAGVALVPAGAVRFDARGRPQPDVSQTWTLGGSQTVSLEAGTGYVR